MEFSEDRVQFYPNRITIAPHRKQDLMFALERKAGLHPSIKNLSKKKTSVNLSTSSKKNIRDSIFAMYQFSKPRTVQISSGKFIYNFRQSFVTLTLPSKQVHSDVEIKKCLNHFLTNVRRKFGVQNYVWKAELQKNANIHFHLSFDKYLPFGAIQWYWLLAIKPLGYVESYSKKFREMSLIQYADNRKLSIADAIRPFANGKRFNWTKPNCVDVSAVTTASSVSNYLSKYFAKSDDSNLDAGRVEKFGKVWARSQSLSKLEWKHKFDYSEVKEFIRQCLAMGGLKKIAYDFATVYYVNFKKLVGVHRRWFDFIVISEGKRYNYPFPAT